MSAKDSVPSKSSFQSIFSAESFQGQNIIVTGGGTGIGRCVAHELASLGAHVILIGRRIEPLIETANEIKTSNARCSYFTLNIRDEKAIELTMEKIASEFAEIHGLVNNAGGQFPSPAEGISANGWRAVIDTNLNGTFLITQAVVKRWMVNNGGGSIVNVVADMWNGFPLMAHTGAARAAVVNLTMSLAVEWGRFGVRINAVAPGVILSSGMLNYPEAIQEQVGEYASQNPSGRLGTESEVSAAIVFLLSRAASYITGATLRIDGGSSLLKMPPFGVSLAESHDAMRVWDAFHHAPSLPPMLQSHYALLARRARL
eukprot:TRINITY_DN3227_c0_g1_i11.p1 TRINITY_DN3227_c0_g1~~TRINITY_DN3227_c0_g1_i11.p1  ORF type:complete len:315 (+),score=60.91 TRINITY_DN3227_c0_g1_i11:46-990(+)